uniref:hypothetical protein n=1 Tax=Enterococcus faecalis TaxID=1351 RepID=UPI00042A6327|nr:hypothetical protein [Enterococcus faecalis]
MNQEELAVKVMQEKDNDNNKKQKKREKELARKKKYRDCLLACAEYPTKLQRSVYFFSHYITNESVFTGIFLLSLTVFEYFVGKVIIHFVSLANDPYVPSERQFIDGVFGFFASIIMFFIILGVIEFIISEYIEDQGPVQGFSYKSIDNEIKTVNQEIQNLTQCLMLEN